MKPAVIYSTSDTDALMDFLSRYKGREGYAGYRLSGNLDSGRATLTILELEKETD